MNLKKIKNKHKIKTSLKSARKYPNVIWFPRSKTDPREIREVLKQALKTQETNPDGFFNDKLLGKYMAKKGSINVVGLDGEKYIDSYNGKSIGDVSYITNARMLMRLFRFLGLVTRIEKGKYIVTDLGKIYATFSGDFPDYKSGLSEEQLLLECLSNFAFYCVNDDPAYRDSKFRIRPFVWLLYTLSLEPQCIYQLIVTAFATRTESKEEIERIKKILKNLREGKTDLKKEWKKVGLNADDYSCVHNFYDSVKILVYLGSSLGLIEKTSNPSYGKKIAGSGRHLTQATVFYTLTEKGQKFLDKYLSYRVLFFDDLYDIFGDKNIIEVVVLLGCLNFKLGNNLIEKIKDTFFKNSINTENIIKKIKEELKINIEHKNGFLKLNSHISFSFYQSVPPEIFQINKIHVFYKNLISDLKKNTNIKIAIIKHSQTKDQGTFKKYVEINKQRYQFPRKSIKELKRAINYSGKEEVFGGQDRFSGRVSPTNSFVIENNELFVDKNRDALDFLVLLRLNDNTLKKFISKNIIELLEYFSLRSDIWEKDQHYTWIRNCFRHLGTEAIYSGSGGMLSRADVSVITPFTGGIEVKSPRENRGIVNIKAIRQAVDAKIQVADQYSNDLPKAAIAIGRRITSQAIKEEKKWAKENQPVLLLNDLVLHYLVLKSVTVNYSIKTLVSFFTSNNGLVDLDTIMSLFIENVKDKKTLQRIEKELQKIA